MNARKTLQLFFSLSLVFWMDSAAQSRWSYPGCADVTDDDFRIEAIIGKTNLHNPLVIDGGLLEPIELDLLWDGEGNVDIYFTERRGELKFYDASENTVTVIGKLDVFHGGGGTDCGLDGIVLSPDFNETKWIYLWYTPLGAQPEVYRLSRFTLTDNRLSTSTEKVIFEQEIRYATMWHSGGCMEFDVYGDLWVTVGKNANDDPGSTNESDGALWRSCEFSSSNTHSARGGAIRIHPIPFPDSQTPRWGIGRTYTIPRGNFGDYFALKYEKEGDPWRASEFRDTSRVMPEVFAKGMRNPWTMAIEPVKRWLSWGENGINRGLLHEEHNFTKVPGFFGYPYFAGNPDTTKCGDGGITCQSGYNVSAQMNVKRVMDPDYPMNESRWNDGLQLLPPAIPATYAYRQNSAMGGPIYRYDGDLQSSVKFPPHFDGMWFLYDFNRGDQGSSQDRGVTKVARFDENYERIIENQDIFKAPKHNLYGPLDWEVGPDGAMYIINYAGWFGTHPNQSIVRIVYTGDCHPSEPRLEEKVNPDVYYPPPGYGCLTPGDPNYDPDAFAHDSMACFNSSSRTARGKLDVPVGAAVYSLTVYVTDPGKHTVSVFNVDGKETAVFRGNGRAQYDLSAISLPGVYFIKVATPRGAIRQKFVRF